MQEIRNGSASRRRPYSQRDIAGRLLSINKEKTALKSIETAMSTLQQGLNDATAGTLETLKNAAVKARNSSEEAAAAIFGKAELDGVGSATWQDMWEHARAYSNGTAYTESQFPNIAADSRCVLCHQSLDEDIVATAGARALRPESAVRVLIDNTITRLKKHQEKAEVEAYESLAKRACSDFRIIVEKTIEYILLADVVGRFRRASNTQGKLHKVAKVTNDDCVFIDDLMTRYSVYEHAQSEEMPSSALELDVFEADVTALQKWIAEFGSRAS